MFLLYSALVRHIWSAWSSSGLLNTRKIQTSGTSPVKAHKDDLKRLQHLTYKEEERTGTVQPGEEKIQGDLIDGYKHPIGEDREGAVRLF